MSERDVHTPRLFKTVARTNGSPCLLGQPPGLFEERQALVDDRRHVRLQSPRGVVGKIVASGTTTDPDVLPAQVTLVEEDSAGHLRLVGMASIAYHAPSRALPVYIPAHLVREMAIVAIAFALFLGGLGVGMVLHGSHADRTPSLVPAQTQTAP